MSEDSDLERFFTNAEPACQAFEHLISAPSLSKRLLVVHGIGGVGKSTLLRMYRLSCQRQGIPVALFTGEETPSLIGLLAGWMKDLSDDDAPSTFEATLTRYRAVQAEVEKRKQAVSTIPGMGPLGSVLGGAEDLVDWLRDFLSRSDLELYLDPIQRLTHSFLEDLAHIAADRRVVLMVDTYERMTTQDDWTRDLALRLPENVLLVISGRTMPRWERAWPGWLGRAEIVRLREMSPNDLRTLVRRYYAYIHSGESDSEQVEAIVRFARGLPMVATTVVRLWVQYGVEELEAVLPQVVTDLVERLLGGVSTEMRSTLEVAAVLRYFNADALRALLSQENDRDANTLYAELRRWPFVISQREGLAVHATMREMMNQELRVRTPERFRVLHERATEYYEAYCKRRPAVSANG